MMPLAFGEQLDIFAGPAPTEWKVHRIISFVVGKKEKRSEKQELDVVFLKNIGGPPKAHKLYKDLQTFSGIVFIDEIKIAIEGYYNPKSTSAYTKGKVTLNRV